MWSRQIIKAVYTIKTQGARAELFVKVNIWAVKAFHQADSVIQFADKKSGTISGRYVEQLLYRYDAVSSFVIQIEDGKITVEFEAEKGITPDDSPSYGYVTISTIRQLWQATVDDLEKTLGQYVVR